MKKRFAFIFFTLLFLGNFFLYSQKKITNFFNFNVKHYKTGIKDASSTVTEPVLQVHSQTINSDETNCNSPVDVFSFDVNDIGSDGNPTIITNVRIKPGITNTADWTDNIQDVKINDGNFVSTASVLIEDNYIDIAISPNDLIIGEGHSGTITISICLNTSGLTDGATLSFMVEANNHGFEADVSGSQFASSFVSDVLSNDFTIYVLCETPDTDASNIVFDNISQTATDVSWTPGNGAGRIIIAKEGSPVDAVPINNTTYYPNNIFGSGEEIGIGNFVIYDGHANNINVTGLSENTQYFFKIFEYNCLSGNEKYFVSGTPAENSITTLPVCTYPTIDASNFNVSNISQTSAEISWTSGNGNGRIVLAKENSNVDALPNDNESYSSSATFGSGYEIGSGNFVVYNGHSDNFNINSLEENTNYYFKIFEYNCEIGNEKYLTSGTPLEGNFITEPDNINHLLSEISIYPNPTKDEIILLLNNYNKKSFYKIINIEGKVILRNNINSLLSE